MSSREQLMIAETVAAMRKAVKRKAYESDSDSSIEHATNRGYKLKKRARFVHEGKLGPPTGPAVYKEVVEHAGYQRAIISRNPPLVDEDGYGIDSDDDDDRVQEALTSAAEDDPYAGVRLEHLLAPLTAVTDLPTHPTMSKPFTSKALTELAVQGRNLVQKENAALWKVRPLLTRLSGDHTWVPCEMMLGPEDLEYFDDDYLARLASRGVKGPTVEETANTTTSSVNGERSAEKAHDSVLAKASKDTPISKSANEAKSSAEDVAMADADGQDGSVPDGAKQNEADSSHPGEDKMLGQEGRAPVTDNQPHKSQENGDAPGNEDENKTHKREQESGKAPAPDEDVKMRDDGATEDAQNRLDDHPPAGSDHPGSRATSPTPDVIDESFIHPIFLAPSAAHPSRDLGLPEQEAEDVRRLLQLYVQKQEEVCRGANKLFMGLMKADRLRKTVLRWAKTEAHVGANRDMSDGEDWYDKEEWGLTEDLKKGQDEEEEETTQTQKKTRNRK
ncbi:Transcriptional regulatory protein rxt2 [Pleurostoma richardsiae]|uniref:Transcriptional regulatory protein rxt2 n=1 Tax=Pleurostoma richardsiae TaxID=41990 RepID=A0AA38RZT2_9PEZI|nr:Transcriptional regulatory protein rxt2 [Pleurostoma richardsiae]